MHRQKIVVHYAARIGCYESEFVRVEGDYLVKKNFIRVELINRDVTETLALRAVQGHGKNTVCLNRFKHVEHHLGGYGDPGFIFLVASCVGEIWCYRGYPTGAVLQGVYHLQQFQNVTGNCAEGLISILKNRSFSGLQYEYIFLANGFPNKVDHKIAIGELYKIHWFRFYSQNLTYT